jgi:uncharacterized oligopeptide transporter (OPT) family protein
MMAGGVLSFLVLIPLITIIGDTVTQIIPPAKMPISNMGPDEIREYYIRYIGAGAVTFGGIMTLIKTLPTIVGAFRDSFKDIRESRGEKSVTKKRTERDMPLIYVLIGSVVLVIFMAVIPNIPTNPLSALMIVLFQSYFRYDYSNVDGNFAHLRWPWLDGRCLSANSACSRIHSLYSLS